MKVFNGVEELVGNTPLIKVNNIIKEEKLLANLMVKAERFNPAGSIKDRTALYMIKDEEEKGLISKGATIIEPTSGNTGIGLGAICASRGYRLILTMPNTMSEERIKVLKAFGAEVVLTDGKLGMQGAIERAKEIEAKTPNSIITGQFTNPANVLAHYKTTAKEIWEDTEGSVDVVIAGIGTGGTISGIGKYLKEKNPRIEIIGVEPKSSPLITSGKSGLHKIQGIGANFIPENFDKSVCDKVVVVSDEDAFYFANLLAKKEGLLVGISSGATMAIGVELSKKEEYKGKNIIVILADLGERYLSTGLFE